MDNWSWLEIAWTLIALVGAYFSFRNINDGIHDRDVLEKLPVPTNAVDGLTRKIQWTIANGNVRRDSLRLVIQVTSLALGIWAGLQPNNPEISLAGLIISVVFIGQSLLLAFSAFEDHKDRLEIIAIGKLREKERYG